MPQYGSKFIDIFTSKIIIKYLKAPVIPDKNLGTVDSLLSIIVTADPATGNLTNNRPPSPP